MQVIFDDKLIFLNKKKSYFQISNDRLKDIWYNVTEKFNAKKIFLMSKTILHK